MPPALWRHIRRQIQNPVAGGALRTIDFLRAQNRAASNATSILGKRERDIEHDIQNRLVTPSGSRQRTSSVSFGRPAPMRRSIRRRSRRRYGRRRRVSRRRGPGGHRARGVGFWTPNSTRTDRSRFARHVRALKDHLTAPIRTTVTSSGCQRSVLTGGTVQHVVALNAASNDPTDPAILDGIVWFRLLPQISRTVGSSGYTGRSFFLKSMSFKMTLIAPQVTYDPCMLLVTLRRYSNLNQENNLNDGVWYLEPGGNTAIVPNSAGNAVGGTQRTQLASTIFNNLRLNPDAGLPIWKKAFQFGTGYKNQYQMKVKVPINKTVNVGGDADGAATDLLATTQYALTFHYMDANTTGTDGRKIVCETKCWFDFCEGV